MKLSLNIILTALLVSVFNLVALLTAQAQPAATNLWRLQVSRFDGESSPAIGTDGTIYQATFDGKLLAITPEGEIKWTFKMGHEIKSSPAIADDGTIYFGARDRKFYAVTPEGKLKWTFPTGAWIDTSPAIGADGTVYFGSWDKKFYALKPNGSLKWAFATSNIVVSSPSIGADGTIYFGSHDKKLYALKPDGTLSWTFLTDGPIISSPAIAADGIIYFTSTDGNFYALKPDGTERWRLRTGGFTESSPVLDAQDDIYLGVNYAKYSIDQDGKKILDYGSPNLINISPVAAADGLVYFTASWGDLSAFDSQGHLAWSAPIGTGVIPDTSPVIDAGGVIYFGDGRNLYSFVATNGAPLAKSSWPMFRANPRHTGRVTGN
ncbi:MAG: PQQ-binding-like beta-propeller repeat protein [Limisphaerales bacterium]